MTGIVRIVSSTGAARAERWKLPALASAQPDPVAPPTPAPAARPASSVPTAAERAAALATARDQGHREGLAQGLAEGRQQGAAEMGERLRALDGICTALARPLRAVDADTERALARLATIIAERVIGAELTIRPQRIVNVVRATLSALAADVQNVEIVVAPEAAKWLREAAVTEGNSGWTLREDAALGAGDCRVHAGASSIDATTASRLKALVDVVLGEPE